MAIDNASRLLKIGGSEIDRMLKEENSTFNTSCDCGAKNCDGMRHFFIEDGYSLYLEKIGKKQRTPITNTCYVDFGNLYENKVLEHVNKALGTNYKEKNNIVNEEFYGHSTINVDGYDPKANVKLLEIKTTRLKNGKVDFGKYYYQINYYMYVMGLDKCILAVANRPEIYHMNKSELQKVKIDKVLIYEYEYDKLHFEQIVMPKISKFVDMLMVSKHDIIFTEEEYNQMIHKEPKKGQLRPRRKLIENTKLVKTIEL